MATSVSAAILPNASYVMYRARTLVMHAWTCVFVGGRRDADVRDQIFGPLRLLGLSHACARGSCDQARLAFGWRCDVTLWITQALVACGREAMTVSEPLLDFQQFGQHAENELKYLQPQFGKKHDNNSARNTKGSLCRSLQRVL